MNAMPRPTQSDLSADALPIRLPLVAHIDCFADLVDESQFPDAQPPRRRQVLWTVGRSLLTFCLGVVATLAWQPYGDAAREMIGAASPQLGWLAPQVALSAQNAADPIAPTPPSPVQQVNATTSIDLDAVWQRVDRIATGQEQLTRTVSQIAASQERIARQITRLQEIEQYLLYKTSEPPRLAHAPGRKHMTRLSRR